MTRLSDDERRLCESIGFGPAVGALLKEATGSPIGRFMGAARQEMELSPAAALSSTVDEQRADSVQETLQSRLPEGYLAFQTGIGNGTDTRSSFIILILKSDDPFEILRLLGTNGANYDLETDDVIDHLTAWQSVAAFQVVGAAFDWVTLRFRILPDNLDDFAVDIYEF